MNAKTKNIVFDWNSTLLDDIQAVHTCMNVIMKQAGRDDISMEDFRAHYEIPFERLYQNLGFAIEEIENLLAMDRDVFHRHYEPMADSADLREGAMEILDHAQQHGVQTLILSNHIVDPIRTQLKRLTIEHMMTDVLAFPSHELQFRDINKGERLRRFMNERQMMPASTIIIGDSVEEIDIAREQGLISVAITGGCVSEQRLRAANPHYVIHSLHELKPIMQERGFVS